MKRIVMMVMVLAGCCADVRAQVDGPGFRLVGIGSRTVPVTAMKMTNLVFPVAVAEGVKVSPDILAKKVKGVENVVELKAVRRGFTPTNLSVYGKDGRLYSFELRYLEDTTVLNYRVVPEDVSSVSAGLLEHPVMLTGLPVDLTTLNADAVLLSSGSGFLHRSVRSEGMRLQLRGIYLRDSLLWLSLRLRNRTRIGFTPASVRVFVVDRKQIKRTASQEVFLAPIYESRLSSVAGDSTAALVLGMEPFTLARGKKMVIEVADRSGGRELRLVLKGKMVLRARVGK